MTAYNQWGRKVGLFVSKPNLSGDGETIDLSQFRIRFSVHNADVESPNNAVIRVYNLGKQTIARILNNGEFSDVVLNAGYVNGNYGIIFRGTIKQFKRGRENNLDSYLDIFAADGDIGYNQGIVNTSLVKGSTPQQTIDNINAAMPGFGGVDYGTLDVGKQNVPSIRGVVLMGMARARLRNVVTQLDAGWSIQDGHIVITSNTGYHDGEAVEINVNTGMIGVPEQTDAGIKVSCLLNSRLRIGNRVKLNNDEITQLLQRDPNEAPIAYNQNTGFQYVANLSRDGMYRAFSVEHEGDTRGHQWQTNVICLSINETAQPGNSVRFN